MLYLSIGLGYVLAYAAGGWALRGHPMLLSLFGTIGLMVPPIAVCAILAHRRRQWAGCQRLFWDTFAIGVGLVDHRPPRLVIREDRAPARVVAAVAHALQPLRRHRPADCALRPAACRCAPGRGRPCRRSSSAATACSRSSSTPTSCSSRAWCPDDQCSGHAPEAGAGAPGVLFTGMRRR